MPCLAPARQGIAFFSLVLAVANQQIEIPVSQLLDTDQDSCGSDQCFGR